MLEPLSESDKCGSLVFPMMCHTVTQCFHDFQWRAEKQRSNKTKFLEKILIFEMSQIHAQKVEEGNLWKTDWFILTIFNGVEWNPIEKESSQIPCTTRDDKQARFSIQNGLNINTRSYLLPNQHKMPQRNTTAVLKIVRLNVTCLSVHAALTHTRATTLHFSERIK